MGKFVPCISRNACTEDGSHCRACGRSHQAIDATRRLTGEVAAFVIAMGYDNVDEFLAYLADKVKKKVRAAGPQNRPET